MSIGPAEQAGNAYYSSFYKLTVMTFVDSYTFDSNYAIVMVFFCK